MGWLIARARARWQYYAQRRELPGTDLILGAVVLCAVLLLVAFSTNPVVCRSGSPKSTLIERHVWIPPLAQVVC